LAHSSQTDALARSFIDQTLPKPQWTHHAHLRVGLWHLLRMSRSAATDTLRERIRNYNEATGVTNSSTSGYHETITRFYIWRIARFLDEVDRSLSIDDLAEELIARYGEKSLPLRYYSQERLMSPEARRAWVDPDLAPLE
jgi:hypothetical protein